MYNYILIIAAFVFGLMLGSFANVCMWRIPQDMSIVKPRSFCPECKKQIPWYYNIPVISYICLKGKCACCRTSISIRYPLVELLTAAVTVTWFMKFSFLPAAFIFTVFGLILIISSGIDFKYYILPHQLTYSLMAAGVLSSWLNPFMDNIYMNRIFYSVLSLITGGAVIYIIRLLGSFVFKREAMGLGDVKLMMGIGAFAGLGGIFWILFLGSLFGSIVGITMILTGKKKKLEHIPFGPYLSLGAIIYINLNEVIYRLFSLYQMSLSNL